jgi:hypothetical protein
LEQSGLPAQGLTLPSSKMTNGDNDDRLKCAASMLPCLFTAQFAVRQAEYVATRPMFLNITQQV